MVKDIIGYEELYSIDEFGNIYSKTANKYIKSNSNKKVKYLQVTLYKNNKGTTFYIHRLVGTHFIPNPLNLPEINHIDGNRLNNHISNLEWVDRLGNIVHAIKNNLRVYTNRLSKEEFIECLNCVINGESYQSLSKRVPYKVPFLSVKLRKIAKELGKEDLLNISLKNQRANRNRQVLAIINSKRATTTERLRIK